MSGIEKRLKKASEDSSSSDTPIKPYNFQMSEIEGFRYRVKVSTRQQSAV